MHGDAVGWYVDIHHRSRQESTTVLHHSNFVLHHREFLRWGKKSLNRIFQGEHVNLGVWPLAALGIAVLFVTTVRPYDWGDRQANYAALYASQGSSVAGQKGMGK